MKEKWKKFSKGAGMLAVLGVVGKIIGVFYRLPLTNILGAEGMGLYQMIFPLYALLLALLCGGVPAAISRYVSELNARGDGAAAKQAVKAMAITVFFLGAAASVGLIVFGGKIAALQGNEKAASAYVAISPAVLFASLISCYRGYFQGLQNLLPSGISQLLEQCVKAVAGLTLAALMVGRGVEYGVLGALIGVSLSEAAAFAYILIRYFVKSGTGKMRKPTLAFEAAAEVILPKSDFKPTVLHSLKKIYSVALPATLGSLVIPLTQAADSFIVINLLVKNGYDTSLATSLYGLFNGPVGSLISMPTVITVALSASLLPKVAYCLGKGISPQEGIDKAMNAFFILLIPCAAVLIIAPMPILSLLYSHGLSAEELHIAARLLRIEGANVIFVGFIQLSTAALTGAGKAKTPVFNLMAGAVIKVATTVTLLPVIGIYGAAVGNAACYVTAALLDLIFAERRFARDIGHKSQAKIIFCALCFAATFCVYFGLKLLMSEISALFAATFISSAVYLLLLIKTKSILLRKMLS